jgi:hypothetical protein
MDSIEDFLSVHESFSCTKLFPTCHDLPTPQVEIIPLNVGPNELDVGQNWEKRS